MSLEMIYRTAMPAPQPPRVRGGRHHGLGQAGLFSTLESDIENPGATIANVLGPMPAVDFWQWLVSEPSGTTVSDMLANAAGKPMTQNETNLISAQAQQAVQTACGPGNANTPACQAAVQQAAKDINAAANQANQQLAGFPYTAYEAGAGLLQNLMAMPTWFLIALGVVGLFVVYEVVSEVVS